MKVEVWFEKAEGLFESMRKQGKLGVQKGRG